MYSDDEIDEQGLAFNGWVRREIANYFRERIQVDRTITKSGILQSLFGVMQDGERTSDLKVVVPRLGISVVEEIPPMNLSAKLYEVGHTNYTIARNAVFAVYEDKTLLWLDDHIRNTDFDLFWQREHIQWHNAREAAVFMMATKFAYLPQPSRAYVLNSVADIPQEGFRSFLISRGANTELIAYEARLADASRKIFPPTLTSDDEGLKLRFCVWMMAGGRVFSISCHITPNGNLSYKGELLGSGLGEVAILR